MTTHTDKTTTETGAKKLNKHGILPGHPIHKRATKLHAIAKANAAKGLDDDSSIDNLIDELCNDIEGGMGDGDSDQEAGDDDGLDGEAN